MRCNAPVSGGSTSVAFTHPSHPAPRPPTDQSPHPLDPQPQVLYTVREDFDSPWTTLAKNALHETKLRSWKAMGPGDKVLDKMAAILDQVG